MSASLLERVIEEYGAPYVEELITEGKLALEWRALGRPEQLRPGSEGASSSREDWRHWLILAGRGFGKTQSGAEATQEEVVQGRRSSIGLIAPTLRDAWQIMINGPTGICTITPPEHRPIPIMSKRLLVWPNGAIGEVFSSEEPDRIRGRNLDWYWAEELGFWKYPDRTWHNLQLALRRTGRQGHKPQGVIATTPKAIDLMRKLIKDATADDSDTVITTGSTYDNAANLDPDFLRTLLKEYEGTHLGEQELYARLLDDARGALWKTKQIDELRATSVNLEEMRRIVVAVDPAVSSHKHSDETGIMVAGLHASGEAYVLEDLSGKYTPAEWANVVVAAYKRWGATKVVAEKNQGGELVGQNMRSHPHGRRLPIKLVWAAQGKFARAEPVAALYERRQVHHLGRLPLLEQEMTQWVPAESKQSPNRVDALTWAITELMLGELIPTYRRPRVVAQRRI